MKNENDRCKRDWKNKVQKKVGEGTQVRKCQKASYHFLEHTHTHTKRSYKSYDVPCLLQWVQEKQLHMKIRQ